jgi:hypothetical protein
MDRREEKYATGKTIYFVLYTADGTEIKKDAAFVSGDVKIKIDGGTENNTTNLPVDNGTDYSLVLTDAELTGKVIEIFIEDQDATAIWLTKVLEIRTFGNANAYYVLDRSTSIPDQLSSSFTEIKGATYSSTTDSLEAISDAISGISGGSGSNTVTITIEDELSIPIPEVRVEIWNEDASVYLQGGYTNSSGIYTASRDDGTYTVKVRKAGWSFSDPFTLVVSGDTAQTYEGAGINIPPAPSADLCTIYEYCMDLDGSPLSSCMGEVIAAAPPIDTGEVSMIAIERRGTYSTDSGIIYWYLPKGISFTFIITKLKIDITRLVPTDVDSIRLLDIPVG